MTERGIFNLIQEKYPFVFRNNRGGFMTGSGYMTFGIPEPRRKGETDDDMKGGDFIGFDETGKFLSIEAKTIRDRMKSGQIRWHNFVIEHGGRSEIWIEREDGAIDIIVDIIVWGEK